MGWVEELVFGCGHPCDPAAVPAVLGLEGGPDSVHRQSSLQCATEAGSHSAKLCPRLRSFRRCCSDTKNAFDDFVCAAEESGDNGLVELDEDVKEQILDAIKDGLGADIWVEVAMNMQRQVPAVFSDGVQLCRQPSSFHRCTGKAVDVSVIMQREVSAVPGCLWLWRCWRLWRAFFSRFLPNFRTPPHRVESRVSSEF